MSINPNAYAATVIVVILGFLGQPIIKRLKYCFKKKKIHHERMPSEDEINKAKKSLEGLYVPHTGFAFSGEAGHVPQIVNPEIFS